MLLEYFKAQSLAATYDWAGTIQCTAALTAGYDFLQAPVHDIAGWRIRGRVRPAPVAPPVSFEHGGAIAAKFILRSRSAFDPALVAPEWAGEVSAKPRMYSRQSMRATKIDRGTATSISAPTVFYAATGAVYTPRTVVGGPKPTIVAGMPRGLVIAAGAEERPHV